MFVLQVNGIDITGANHQEAVMALISPSYEIVLDVRHDPQPAGLKVRIIAWLYVNFFCHSSLRTSNEKFYLS